MRKIFPVLFFLLTASCSFGQKNLTLLSHYPFSPGITCAGAWHYNDTVGHKEYALVGTSNGLTIVDITNPADPQHVFDVPDTTNLWREVKVWSHYAYVSCEGGFLGGGITIIDLSNLPGTPVYKKFTSDGPIAGNLQSAHTVQCVDGYLYVNGSNQTNGKGGGTIIYSLADPWNPHYVNAYKAQYVHDCFVRGNLMVTSEIFAHPSGFSIIDITNKNNLVVLASNQTPFNFNHNAWMSDDSKYLYTTDELNNAPLASYDISDVQNISGPLDLYLTNKNPVGEVHNVRVLNDFLINADYGDNTHTGAQVTIVDGARPANLIEIADYTVGTLGLGHMISWDADPYPLSGNIIVTDIDQGLFVFAPTYRRACYLEGVVTDSITGTPLNNVKVEILSTIAGDSTKFTGDYKTGVADSGTYTVRFTKTGYNTKTFNDVELKNGVLTIIDAQLWNGILGVDEKANALGLMHAYPNPVQYDATISIDPELLSKGHKIHLLVRDMTGRTVRELRNVNQSTVTVERNGMPAGSYSIQLLDDTKKIAETTIVFQ